MIAIFASERVNTQIGGDMLFRGWGTRLEVLIFWSNTPVGMTESMWLYLVQGKMGNFTKLPDMLRKKRR